jgi:hypothetical protein
MITYRERIYDVYNFLGFLIYRGDDKYDLIAKALNPMNVGTHSQKVPTTKTNKNLKKTGERKS